MMLSKPPSDEGTWVKSDHQWKATEEAPGIMVWQLTRVQALSLMAGGALIKELPFRWIQRPGTDDGPRTGCLVAPIARGAVMMVTPDAWIDGQPWACLRHSERPHPLVSALTEGQRCWFAFDERQVFHATTPPTLGKDNLLIFQINRGIM
jgi:hypothetical protein